jgi:hypothetical protein
VTEDLDMRKNVFLFLILLAMGLYGCSSSNNEAANGVHPQDWFVAHRAAAAPAGPTFADCQGCHGVALTGSATVPSCFSATFNGQGCHPGGPGTAPHPLDGTYLSGANHGPEAKADLTACQLCHGEIGGPGTNPRFNRGIDSAGGTGCEACHGLNYAHPPAWAGPNATFHYSAGNIQNACTLCHGVALDGVGGVGVSCLSCHAEATTFTLDCTFCHGTPPDGTADLDVPTPVPHRSVALIPLHDVCVVCHGMKEGAVAGTFASVANYALFNKATDTIGDHWDGNINMSSTPQYNQTNFGCDAAGCHGNDAAHQLSDSGLPVELAAYGFGDALVHPVDGTFLNPANHGPAAKGLTAAFPNGMADCQPCHATAGPNPRFNVGIISVGGNGCENCHNDLTAHPSAGVRENSPWYDGFFTHRDVNGFTTMCTLCHGANLGGPADGGVGPACTSCHGADPVANPTNCVSCHGTPPNGAAPVGAVTANRTGQHNRFGHTTLVNAVPSLTCARCHDGAGFGTAAHFDQVLPADVNIALPNPEDTVISVSDGTNTTCNGNCHLPDAGGVGLTFTHINSLWY